MTIMAENLSEFIRKLSKEYDPDSENSFVSFYINRVVDKNFIDRRIKACESVLERNELKNFKNTVKNILDALKKNTGENIAIFASHKHNFLKHIILHVNIENLMVVDSSPYIRPLARLKDEWESFTLLLISSNYSKIFSVSMGEVKNSKKLTADIMNKHKKGGWSQARFNRLRRGAIHAFFSEVEEALQKRADERIILAGPGQAKLQFRELLPKNLKDNVVDIIDIDIDDEVELMKKSKNIISEREELKSQEAVELLKAEILKDGLVVYGIEETLDAVRNGQVELLLVEKNYAPRGWICENCQMVKEGIQKTCPYCGKKTSEVDIIEEILEFAERTDADVEFTDYKELANLGHVGAILRFK